MFNKLLEERKEIFNKIDTSFDETFNSVVNKVSRSVKAGGNVYFAGNGGSAAEAQHMSAEYLATLNHKNFRKGIKAFALTTDTSFITAWTNDFGYDEVFSRQIETFGKENDIFYAYSTSGNSANIIKAIEAANLLKMIVIGFTGNEGGMMKDICSDCFIVPSSKTTLIQEVHTALGHEICFQVEKEIFFSE